MNNTISERAMLVSLSVSMWTARKHDKRVDKHVDTHYASSDAGHFSKTLIAEDAIKAVAATANAGRTYHYQQTLPWSDKGERLLPVLNFATYSAEMRKLHAEFDTAVATFCTNYNALVDDARLRLNGLFSLADYPTDIASKFAWSTEILPIPTAADFRVDLAADELATIQADIETRTNNAIQSAHADLYRRLTEAVGHMADKLADKDAVFRNSLVENLAELCELLPRLNVLQDAQLDTLRQQVEAKLTRYTADQLRDSAGLRKRTAQEASAILDALGGMYASA